ncbi:hypothetical protein C9374_004582 [Naegleria lovaniensis]|uniref:Uncharacterized protein n=1 Tax=Naegleria lovaniensis TaxID=51637 RepID=A0AA88GMU6_NAELO|nr:uncharacterized protein C9374_004582 [Naegleria lovaniensis]KAG2383245.1 hypothetical protein C9374_004582 [Naegleria lovaniensis]
MQAPVVPSAQSFSDDDQSSTSLMTNDTVINKNLTNGLSSSSPNITSEVLVNITNQVIREIIQTNLSGHHIPSSVAVNNASYLYMILSFFARIISDIIILLLMMTILLILFPSLLKPLQYAFQSILITFRTSVDALLNLKDTLEKAYQQECEEKAFKQVSSHASQLFNQMESKHTTTQELQPSEEKPNRLHQPKVSPEEKWYELTFPLR